jgi:hypothetical protein
MDTTMAFPLVLEVPARVILFILAIFVYRTKQPLKR